MDDRVKVIERFITDVAELPDRTSPDDWPDAMLVTADELRGLLTPMVAALSAMQGDGWRGIESAPKQQFPDSLGICVAQLWGTRWSFHHAWWDDQQEMWTDIFSDRLLGPTHWQPLPAPPSAPGDEAEHPGVEALREWLPDQTPSRAAADVELVARLRNMRTGDFDYENDRWRINPLALEAANRIEVLSGPVQQKLWLWRNFVDGRLEYWAFDNAYPSEDCGDPLTLGSPVGYALFKPSINGRPDVPDHEVLAEIALSRPVEVSEAMVQAGVDAFCGWHKAESFDELDRVRITKAFSAMLAAREAGDD